MIMVLRLKGVTRDLVAGETRKEDAEKGGRGGMGGNASETLADGNTSWVSGKHFAQEG